MENESHLSTYMKSSFTQPSETFNANTSLENCIKIKLEIELEEESGLVNQDDLFGHLRIADLNQNRIPNKCSIVENNCSDLLKRPDIQSASEVKETNMSPAVQNDKFNDCIYNHLQNVSFDIASGEEKSLSISRKRKKRQHSFILAEKKREYRNRIKKENPSMWYAMKEKEAYKRSEQRKEKRQILLQMQALMQFCSVPDSPEIDDHKFCLETLKKRYPKIWKELTDALSAIEQRNHNLKQNPERHLSKPINMYKDVIEAQKKYLYRQRMKLEKPELYEQQKARDSYAKSIRRHMLKEQLSKTQSNAKN